MESPLMPFTKWTQCVPQIAFLITMFMATDECHCQLCTEKLLRAQPVVAAVTYNCSEK